MTKSGSFAKQNGRVGTGVAWRKTTTTTWMIRALARKKEMASRSQSQSRNWNRNRSPGRRVRTTMKSRQSFMSHGREKRRRVVENSDEDKRGRNQERKGKGKGREEEEEADGTEEEEEEVSPEEDKARKNALTAVARGSFLTLCERKDGAEAPATWREHGKPFTEKRTAASEEARAAQITRKTVGSAGSGEAEGLDMGQLSRYRNKEDEGTYNEDRVKKNVGTLESAQQKELLATRAGACKGTSVGGKECDSLFVICEWSP
ncbi:hypothetical protein BDV93DRAFT_509505 [Ceratobasidium sp. AG-I]|nr:hypothetical protein BDV93DRAFT_509505 [Ceratobasidium sp. AG-I]